MTATQFESRRYVPAKEVAQILRGRLKHSFPGTKFSVRTEHHTAVNISWVDGPTEKDVAPLTWDVKGGHFDGMQDIFVDAAPDVLANEDGTFELVSYGADYIFTHREISDGWRDRVFQMFSLLIGRDLDPSDWSVWNQHVPLTCRGLDGELLRMRDTDTDDLRSVFHQFVSVRQGGSLDMSAPDAREP